jgi:hypothetical protein
VRDFVERHAEVIGCDVDAFALAALGNFSAALDHRFALKMQRHGPWFALLRLWLLLVGRPSTKKSPIIDTATDEILAVQVVQQKTYQQEYAAYLEAKEAGSTTAVEPKRPPCLVMMDITYEKVGEVLAKQERAGCLVKRDELAGWIGSMEKYGHGKGGLADRSFWLSAYDGKPYYQARISRGELFVPLLSASIIGGAQIKRLAEIGGLTNDGLLQRFLPCMVKDAGLPKDVWVDTAVEYYAFLTRRLLNAEPAKLTLEDEALALMRDLIKQLKDVELATEGFAEGIDGFIGKLPGILGSLALILHLAAEPKGAARLVVRRETVENAGRVVFDFILPHAFEFYRALEGASGGDRIQRIASYILTSGKTRFRPSDFTAGVRSLRGLTSADLVKQISPLVAGGWLTPEGPPLLPVAWQLNLAVPSAMAERTAVERKRKAEIISIIRAAGAQRKRP